MVRGMAAQQRTIRHVYVAYAMRYAREETHEYHAARSALRA